MRGAEGRIDMLYSLASSLDAASLRVQLAAPWLDTAQLIAAAPLQMAGTYHTATVVAHSPGADIRVYTNSDIFRTDGTCTACHLMCPAGRRGRATRWLAKEPDRFYFPYNDF